MTRTFDIAPAQRTATPIIVGVIGPSGTGKTYSALRLASGMQRVHGGDIHVIDTEATRALAYAPRPGAEKEAGTFRFHHVPFAPPFSPLDYLDAIHQCVARGAKTIVIDSMSHEHESIGGVLDMHEKELDRLVPNDDQKARDRKSFAAWAKPKAMRRQLITGMLQVPCNFILCFRAKEKLQPVRGSEPKQLGWMPIAGDEFFYEAPLRFLLLPGANGYPVLSSSFEGESSAIRIPRQFEHLFDPNKPRQLSEELGEQIARWAAGQPIGQDTHAELLAAYAACSSGEALAELEAKRRAAWGRATANEKQALKSAADAAQARIGKEGAQ